MQSTNDLLAAVETYFGALHGCDLTLFDRVFHPASSLFNSEDGIITVEPIAAYRAVIAERMSPKSLSQPREDAILMIDWLSQEEALVKVRLRIHDKTFVDHLCFAKDEKAWRIMAKTWHLER